MAKKILSEIFLIAVPYLTAPHRTEVNLNQLHPSSELYQIAPHVVLHSEKKFRIF